MMMKYQLLNTGVILNCYLKLDKYINATCMLNWLSAAIIIHAFISNKLDYCNSLLYGLPNFQIQHLQKIHNIVLRILTKFKRDNHIIETFTLASCSLSLSIQNYCSNYIFYLSLHNGIFPQQLKIAKVLPVFKERKKERNMTFLIIDQFRFYLKFFF